MNESLEVRAKAAIDEMYEAQAGSFLHEVKADLLRWATVIHDLREALRALEDEVVLP